MSSRGSLVMIGFQHVECFEVEGVRDRVRDKMTWDECVKDLVELGLLREWASVRVRWRGLICTKRPTRVSMKNGR